MNKMLIPKLQELTRQNHFAVGIILLLGFTLLIPKQQLAAAEPQILISSGVAHPGDVLLVSITGHHDLLSPSGRFQNKPLGFFRASAGTYLALIGLDLEVATGAYHLNIETLDSTNTRYTWGKDLFVEYKSFPTRKITVNQKYVTLATEDNARAERETAALMGVFSTCTSETYLQGNFILPIPKTISSGFGERRIFNNVPKSPHSGADLRAPAGTPVRAPARGKVVLTADFFYQGKTVVLDHGYGLFTYYIHLSSIAVKEGAVLSRGNLIGKVGRTGRTSGPHLHWAVRLNNARVDPLSLLSLDLERYLGATNALHKQRN